MAKTRAKASKVVSSKKKIFSGEQNLEIMANKSNQSLVDNSLSDEGLVSENYLHLLLESYRNQINMLQMELKTKNETISDLINVIKTSSKTVAVSNDKQIDSNKNIARPKSRASDLQDRKDLYNAWNFPKKVALLLRRISSC